MQKTRPQNSKKLASYSDFKFEKKIYKKFLNFCKANKNCDYPPLDRVKLLTQHCIDLQLKPLAMILAQEALGGNFGTPAAIFAHL